MYLETYNELTSILVDINSCEKKIKSLEAIKDRVLEVTDGKPKPISIKIDEGWIHTPTANVRSERFVEYLTEEIEYHNSKMEELKDRFAKI